MIKLRPCSAGPKIFGVLFYFMIAGSVQTAWSAPLKFEHGPIAVSVDDSNQEHTTKLNFSFPTAGQATLEVVENPNRLVIDLSAVTVKQNKTFKVEGTVVTGIRFGAHPDKTRIVLDIASEKMPAFSESKSPGKLVLSLNSSESPTEQPIKTELPLSMATPEQHTPTTPVITPTLSTPKVTPVPVTETSPTPKMTVVASPSPTPLPTPLPAPLLTPLNTPNPTPIEQTTSSSTLLPVAEPTVEKSASVIPAGAQAIEAVNFEYLGPDRVPVIKLSLRNRSEFKLSKKSDRVFTLLIPKAGIAQPHLNLPQYPPFDFTGFTHVLVEKLGDGAQVTIGVDSGTRIASVAKENKILIRTLNQ